MSIPQSDYFQRLRRKLWIGTLSFHAFLLALVLGFKPELLQPALFGIALGVFYLWSLIQDASRPKGKGQFVFSLLRMAVLAFLAVQVSAGGVYDFAVVMCGLLSYKVVLTVEYVVQAMPAFRKQNTQSPVNASSCSTLKATAPSPSECTIDIESNG